MNDIPKSIFNPEEAAEYLGIGKDLLLKLFRERKIQGQKLGSRTIRFHRDDLDAYIKNGASEPGMESPVMSNVG